MRIVVLDGYTLNPGDLSWEALEALAPCKIYDRTDDGLIVERSCEADILLTNKTLLMCETIEQLPRLKHIAVLATGYNVVDPAAARQRGIGVSNVPAYGTESVAQMTFAHLLNLTRRVAHHGQTVRQGKWTKCEDFCYWDFPQIALNGLTMGIVGLGRIGRAVAEIALAFGMEVIAYDKLPAADAPEGVKLTSLDAVFREGDVVSLHCPLTDDNVGLVSAERLAMMKPTALLINTSRGPLVDEAALADALNTERLAGAGLDVLAVEPPQPDNPLLTVKNCFITPHIAWASRSARARLLSIVVANVRAFLAGECSNIVN